MERCPVCGEVLGALESRKENLYAGGCCNPNCPIIFRTKEMFNKLDACMMINDLVRDGGKK